MNIIKKQLWHTAIHIAIITALAVALSYTFIYSFTSMLALKSSIEVKDYQLSDLYSVVTDKSSPKKLNDSIVLIATDGLSRNEIAQLLNTIKQSKPSAIGLDIIFEHAYESDSLLITATSSPNVILAQRFADDEDQTIHKSYFCDSSHLAQNGITNIEQGVVRRFRHCFDLKGNRQSSFAATIANVSGLGLTDTHAQETYIYYPSNEFRSLTPGTIYDNPDKCDEILNNRIVLLGDFDDIHDMYQTPLGLMSGIKIQASIIATIIGNHSIEQVSTATSWAIAIFACIIMVLINLLLAKRHPATGKLIFRLVQLLLLYLFFWAGCTLFARANLYIDFVPALTLIAIGLLAYDIYFGLLDLYKRMTNKRNTK